MCAIQSVIMLEALSSYSLDLESYLKAIIYIAPYIFFNIIPVAFITAYILFLKELRKSRVFVALGNLGLSIREISKPFFMVAIIVTAIHYLISLSIMPYSHHKFRNLKFAIENAQVLDMLKNKTFLNTNSGLTIYVEKSSKNMLGGIFISDSRNQDKQTTIIAELGYIERHENGLIKLVLQNGSLHSFGNHDHRSFAPSPTTDGIIGAEMPKNMEYADEMHDDFQKVGKQRLAVKSGVDKSFNDYHSMQFARYIVDLEDNTKIISMNTREADYKEFTVSEAWQRIKLATKEKDRVAGIISLVHRLTWPLYSLILYWLCNIIMLGQYTYSREKSSKLSALSGLTCVVIIIANFLIQSISSQNIYALSALLLLLIVPGGYCHYSLKNK